LSSDVTDAVYNASATFIYNNQQLNTYGVCHRWLQSKRDCYAEVIQVTCNYTSASSTDVINLLRTILYDMLFTQVLGQWCTTLSE